MKRPADVASHIFTRFQKAYDEPRLRPWIRQGRFVHAVLLQSEERRSAVAKEIVELERSHTPSRNIDGKLMTYVVPLGPRLEEALNALTVPMA